MAGEQAFFLATAGISAMPLCFEVAYLDEGGEQQSALVEAGGLPFEDAGPIRSFPSYKGQRNNPGLWWSATVRAHVGFESWFERDELMMLDFDPTVTGIASQPFWLFWNQGGKQRSHAPDFFARTSDGTGLVIDCHLAEKTKPRDQAAFHATAAACDQVGWTYRLHDTPADQVLVRNVRWLAGYRHPRHHRMDVATRLLEAFARPRQLLAGVRLVGDQIGVLPTAYHLMWNHVLDVDLLTPLHEDIEVVCTGGSA